ncbi:MAG TPA: ELWxxDGT repeat protein [Thermoanaerobaculia bacterium]
MALGAPAFPKRPGRQGKHARRFRFASLAIFALVSSLGSATYPQLGSPFLVRDINSTPVPGAGSYPGFLTPSGGVIYFGAYDPADGGELWRTDGTAEGTRLVKDIVPGPNGSGIVFLTDVRGTLFFVSNGAYGSELWRSDGTEDGTVRVKTFRASALKLVNGDGTLFFAVNDIFTGALDLWKSDGTEVGTTRAAGIPTGSYFNNPFWAGGRLFFQTAVFGLWVSDGTQAGTFELSHDLVIQPGTLAAFHNRLYFVASAAQGYGLWTSDGTVKGTNLVMSFESSHGGLVEFQGSLYFTAGSSAGTGLWKSDGTSLGTTFLQESDTAADGTVPVEVDGKLFYISSGGTIWKTDGTSSDAVAITTVPESTIFQVGGAGGLFYFVSFDAKLWRCDGTPEGTFTLRQTYVSNTLPSMVAVNGLMLFLANDASTGPELWKTDGTLSGTVILRDINLGAGASNPAELVNLSGAVYFAANDGVNGPEIWKTDGTRDGTLSIKNFPIPPTDFPAYYGPHSLIRVNENLLFFWNLAPVIGRNGLWKTDGTSQGTTLLGNLGGQGISLTKLGNNVFFFGDDGVHGSEIWKSDGTVEGTVMVKDLMPGSDSPFDLYYPKMAAASGGKYFVQGSDSSGGYIGRELLVSDGTETGTHLLKDINSGFGDSLPNDLTDVNGTLFFFADDGGHGFELWKSDGTEAGTVLVKDINPGPGSSVGAPSVQMMSVGGLAYFGAYDGVHGAELWRSDGTEAGTFLLKDIAVGDADSNPLSLGSLGGVLFFSADDGVHGRGLWKTDGTPSGTVLVKAIEPGVDMIDAGGFIVFSASDGVHGQEVWISDGTPEGTSRLTDVAPGPTSFSPSFFARLGPFVLFSGDDGQHGRELWGFRAAGVDHTTSPKTSPHSVPFRPPH